MEYINMDKRFKISKTLIINFIFLLLFIAAINQPIDAFGFDSANSCSTQASKLSRRGRAQMLAAIPCDLARQAYCHLPGSAYPWHAVRRFVHENHGLMKRMYGDVRHISVLRDEILNNEIDVDDVEIAAERYSKEPHRSRAAKYMHAQREEYGGIKNNDVLMEPHFRPVSTATTVPDTTREEHTNMASEKVEAKIEEERPVTITSGTLRRRTNVSANSGGGHRRRVNVYVNRNRPTHSSLRRRTTTTTTTEEPKLLAENNEQTSKIVLHEETIHEIPEDDGNLASNSVYETPTSPEAPLHMGDNIQIIESPQLGQLQKPLTEQKNSSESATISTTLKVVTTSLTKVRPAPDPPAPVAPTPLQQKPAYQGESQRPGLQQLQKLKLQQVKQQSAAVAGGAKESSTLKSKPANESERTQSDTAFAPANTGATAQPLKAATNSDVDITTDADNGTTLSGSGKTNFDTDATPPTAATVAAALAAATQANTQHQHQQYVTNKNEHRFGENKADLPPTTAIEQTIPTTVATKLTSTQAELSSAAKATSSPSTATTGAEASAAHVELLANEKIQHPQSASQQSPQTTPISAAAAASTKPVLRDGQLYQDALKQEVKPSANMRGINACPVKEEVVAPFWANNTRGEVLALLNLYPFEQYVHWEKCTHEHRQMYCREGCRCEQQYRLHRLLAYDPHNECRGIFSDWFRFPSCCICKCYGIPMEFRATSRSPRSERMDEFETVAEYTDYDDDITNADESVEALEEPQTQHPIDVAEQMVRQAIYEHATEDWYRPKDEFDFYEG
ncbi:protein spaetzle 4 [Anastrepha ludens]|uniref:protein spaetzle 4 n=1 Tax=Anastrepha ludens TaxID=28586 RepID=UPI0023B12F8E|nr:protein spaetzle 4 [Anastrepha ludens]